MADEDPRAIRLTFRYTDNTIELADVQQVIQWVPPSEYLDDRQDRSGYWFELRDGAGALLFREDLPPTLGEDYEIFPEDPAGEIVRRPGTGGIHTFTIVVPEMTQAQQLALVGSPVSAERRSEAAADLATFDFAEVRHRAARHP
jgi:hypothetical protein